jgi:hypothetical protein
MRFNHRLRVKAAASMALASTVVPGWANLPLDAQTPIGAAPTVNSRATPGGQAIEGSSRWSFEVASIRLAKPGTPIRSNFSMDIEDTPVRPGGLFSAVLPLRNYIEFAYKIMHTREQEDTMLN